MMKNVLIFTVVAVVGAFFWVPVLHDGFALYRLVPFVGPTPSFITKDLLPD